MSTDLSDTEWSDLVLSVGTHKKNRRLKPLEVSSYIARAVDHHSLKFISEKIDLGNYMIERFLRLLKLPEEIQPLVIWGRYPGYLSFSVAAEIANLKDPSSSRDLAKAVLENGLKEIEVRATIQSMYRTGINLGKAVKSVLNLRPRTENLIMFMGALPTGVNERIDQSVARDRLRKFLSSKAGAKNVVSVSFNEGKYSFILNTDDEQSSRFARTIDKRNLGRVVMNALDS